MYIIDNNYANYNAGANATQQIYNNGYDTGTARGNLYSQGYNAVDSALAAQGNYYQQDFNNFMNVTGQNANIYGQMLSGSQTPISTAALSQSALMGVPINANNAGIGLNNAGWNGVNSLNNLQMQADQINGQNSTGGFFGGLLGSAVSGFGSGLGRAAGALWF